MECKEVTSIQMPAIHEIPFRLRNSTTWCRIDDEAFSIWSRDSNKVKSPQKVGLLRVDALKGFQHHCPFGYWALAFDIAQ